MAKAKNREIQEAKNKEDEFSAVIDVSEIKTSCECANPIWFDDSAFGLGWRCVKCGHKDSDQKRQNRQL